MTSKRKDQIHTLLKGIETGDPESVVVVNEAKYIQHNPETHEGSEGLASLFKRIARTSPQVNIVRIFEDGEYIFAQTEYDFANSTLLQDNEKANALGENALSVVLANQGATQKSITSLAFLIGK